MQSTEYSKMWLKLTFASPNPTFIRGQKLCSSSYYQITLRSRSTFQNLERTMWLAKLGKGILSSIEKAFFGRDERRALLETLVWEATYTEDGTKWKFSPQTKLITIWFLKYNINIVVVRHEISTRIKKSPFLVVKNVWSVSRVWGQNNGNQGRGN